MCFFSEVFFLILILILIFMWIFLLEIKSPIGSLCTDTFVIHFLCDHKSIFEHACKLNGKILEIQLS